MPDGMKFRCLRCGKLFSTLRALTIHAEVKREDGVLATFIRAKEEKADDRNQD